MAALRKIALVIDCVIKLNTSNQFKRTESPHKTENNSYLMIYFNTIQLLEKVQFTTGLRDVLNTEVIIVD